ncbi:uncharacterized protein LOC105427957 isoform X2 [Pogonomyrmex barbatus]|nr:uncharacterized protein LOC105427957 isoform X2 [Pogonomyrmex barbatus]
MVLSFLENIVLEIVVIVITFLLWHKKSDVSTSRLVEFIAEKTICLVFSIYKWCMTLKWYMQLRTLKKIHRFTMIARRSIATITNVPGRVGRSLDDECLGAAIVRRGKYASLLNLDRFSAESPSRAYFKSLTTLITDDIRDPNDVNDYDSDANDLSVAEKSMKMLNVTAEDVMDARARIQERFYWEEQGAKTPEAIEEVMAQFSLGKDREEMIDSSENEKMAKNDLKKLTF